jgi:hypothetical protein
VRSHLERERKRKREKKKEREKERGRTREIDREREREGVRVKEAHILIDFERLYLSAGVSWRSINSIKKTASAAGAKQKLIVKTGRDTLRPPRLRDDLIE